MEADRLRDELVAMAAEDQRTRQELAEDGSLFEGYHPRMREVHDRNAARLLVILDEHGWPGRSVVGVKATEAAWLILQHAISHPTLQRRGLALLQAAARAGEIPIIYAAMLEDRVRTCEGRGQVFGTQFDWDENGELSPLPIAAEEEVDARRRAVGLGPLEDAIRSHRERARRSGEAPPRDWLARERDKEAWLKETGWR